MKCSAALAPSVSSTSGTREYDAYGNVVSSSGSWSGPFGYGGVYGYREDGGLLLLGRRLYDPSTGRILTRDPAEDGRNWYAYCEGDPVNYADPEGLARLYLGWSTVGPGNHTFLVIVDENTGESWRIEGVPEKPGAFKGDRGKLKNGSGGPGRGKPPRDSVPIKDDDRSGKWWFDKLNGIGEEVESKGLPYDPLGNNSNAFLWTVIVRAGLADEWRDSGRSGDISGNGWAMSPGGSFWAPGWGNLLPR